MKFSYSEGLAQLPKPANEKWREGVWDAQVFEHGSMLLEVFAPRNRDYQTPHDRDELYFVARGGAEFVREGERMRCATGDALFVPAGVEHHFENMSEDFVTWVVFWGPKGGE
jgi:mannose-6-phosphate isomerase-like protein (cupin superfamily)